MAVKECRGGSPAALRRHAGGCQRRSGAALFAVDMASAAVGASTRRVRGHPATERSCVTNPSPKRSGSLGNPTALAEVDRGLPDGLKLVPNLGIGVQIGLYLSPDLLPGLAFEAGEEVVHVGVKG